MHQDDGAGCGLAQDEGRDLTGRFSRVVGAVDGPEPETHPHPPHGVEDLQVIGAPGGAHEMGFSYPEPFDDLVAAFRLPHDLLDPKGVELWVREAVVFDVVSGLVERGRDRGVAVGELSHQEERAGDSRRGKDGHQLLHPVFPRPVVEGQGDLSDEGVSGGDAPAGPLGVQGPPLQAQEQGDAGQQNGTSYSGQTVSILSRQERLSAPLRCFCFCFCREIPLCESKLEIL